MRLFVLGFCIAICFLFIVYKLDQNFFGFVSSNLIKEKKYLNSISLEISSWPKLTIDKNISAKTFLKTMSASCKLLLKNQSGIFEIDSKYWEPICKIANNADKLNDKESLQAIQEYLIPINVKANGDDEGLATGYFEIELNGSETFLPGYTPIYMRPKNIIDVDLSEFDQELKNRFVSGQIIGNRLKPLPNRKDINEGIYEGKNLEIAWIKDQLDVFFLHIQGSGRIKFSDGNITRIGYAGSNGHKYKSIGKEMVSLGLIDRKNISMQTIRQWLEENPTRVNDILEKNPRYIFFKKMDIQNGPIGAASVPLVAQNSVAVDKKYYYMGLPLFVKTNNKTSYLLVAQDVGYAIRGPLRLDIFMGTGKIAGIKAGKMAENIKIWALIPREALKGLKLSQDFL